MHYKNVQNQRVKGQVTAHRNVSAVKTLSQQQISDKLTDSKPRENYATAERNM